MHGVLGAAIQNYICTEFGMACWQETSAAAKVPGQRFEPMLKYDDHLLDDVLDELGRYLERETDDLLEDLGTYLVTSKDMTWLPRLLQFGGVNYADFIRQLPQVPKRVALAAFDFGLPKLCVENLQKGQFDLHVKTELNQWCSILVGLLRSMGDQYGTLCAVTRIKRSVLRIDIYDDQHAEAPKFDFSPMEREC